MISELFVILYSAIYVVFAVLVFVDTPFADYIDAVGYIGIALLAFALHPLHKRAKSESKDIT